MNDRLLKLFHYFEHLKVVETLVSEIVQMDYYVYNFVEDEAIALIDYFLTKYNKEIKEIAKLYKDTVVIEDDPDVYESKDSEEVNSDAEYIRDCLIIIAAVKSGLRQSYKQVIDEIEGR